MAFLRKKSKILTSTSGSTKNFVKKIHTFLSADDIAIGLTHLHFYPQLKERDVTVDKETVTRYGYFEFYLKSATWKVSEVSPAPENQV